jgi:MFS family permease
VTGRAAVGGRGSRSGVDPHKVRGTYGLMIDPVFGPFFWGRVLSSSGIWIHNIVAAIVAYELTGSALVVGLVTAAQFTPQILLAPLSGKMTDRGNAPRQIAAGRLLAGAASVGLGVWIWAAGGVDGLDTAWPILGFSLLVGVGFVVGGPAMQSIIPALIRPGELAAAMALGSVPMIVARAAGPASGALLATQVEAATAFAIAGGTNLLHGVIVLALRLPARLSGAQATEGTDFSVRASLRHLGRDRPLLVLLLGIAATGYGTEPAVTLTPTLAAGVGAGPSLVGWFASLFGIGAGVGFVLFGPIHRRIDLPELGSLGLVTLASGTLVVAAGTTAAVMLAGFGIAGFGMTLAFTSLTTQIQQRTPELLRGRIMALWYVGFLGSRPLAAGVSGSVADQLSAAAALLLTAAVVAVAACVTWRGRSGPPPAAVS